MAGYVVTGGAGFIGTELVKELVRQGHGVRVVDKAHPTPERRVAGIQVRYVQADITDTDAGLTKLFTGCVGVFHLAGVASVAACQTNPESTWKTNVLGTYKVLEAARSAKIRRVVFASSLAVAGPPTVYGAQKEEAEVFCISPANLKYLETVCLRLSRVYGPGHESVVTRFLEQHRRGESFTIQDHGHQRCALVYITDVVQVLYRAMVKRKVGSGEVMDIGGPSVSINQLVGYIHGSGQAPFILTEPSRVLDDPEPNPAFAQKFLGWAPQVPLTRGLEYLR